MSTAASSSPQAQPAIRPCGRTQDKLDDLLKQSNYNSDSPAFKMYFFTNNTFASRDVPLEFRPRPDLLVDLPRCLQCGGTIAEHLSAMASAAVSAHPPVTTFAVANAAGAPPVLPVFSAEVPGGDDTLLSADRDLILKGVRLAMLSKAHEPRMKYLALSDTPTTDSLSREFREVCTDRRCAVCGFLQDSNAYSFSAVKYPTQNVRDGKGIFPPVTMAHVVATREAAKAIGASYSTRNLIYLCGTKGWKGSCHDYFDENQLAFVWKPLKSKWKVCVHPDQSFLGSLVDLPSKPNRSALHARATRCVTAFLDSFTGSDLEDLAQVTPPRTASSANNAKSASGSTQESSTTKSQRTESNRSSTAHSPKQRDPAAPANSTTAPNDESTTRGAQQNCSATATLVASSLALVPHLRLSVSDWSELEIASTDVRGSVEATIVSSRTSSSASSSSSYCGSFGSKLETSAYTSESAAQIKKCLIEHGVPNAEADALLLLTEQGLVKRSNEAWSTVRRILKGCHLPKATHSAVYQSLVSPV